MADIRKKHTLQLKVKIALESIKGEKTTAQITSKYGVHATQVAIWKKKALEAISEAFSRNRKKSDIEQSKLIDELYKQIGQLSVEVDWLKKKSNLLL